MENLKTVENLVKEIMQPKILATIIILVYFVSIFHIWIFFYKIGTKLYGYKYAVLASLVVQWLRICLPMQGTWVRALVGEAPTCRGATKPLRHNYWARAPRACAPQQEKPPQWEACAPQRRVAPAHRN